MAEKNGRSELHGLFGALLGGLMASLVGSLVFTFLINLDGNSPSWSSLAAVLIGLGCAIVFMIAGLLTTDRAVWLSSSFYFASGFTTLWSLALSFGVEPRWVVPVALGVAVSLGVFVGWFRLGRTKPVAPALSAIAVPPVAPAAAEAGVEA